MGLGRGKIRAKEQSRLSPASDRTIGRRVDWGRMKREEIENKDRKRAIFRLVLSYIVVPRELFGRNSE